MSLLTLFGKKSNRVTADFGVFYEGMASVANITTASGVFYQYTTNSMLANNGVFFSRIPTNSFSNNVAVFYTTAYSHFSKRVGVFYTAFKDNSLGVSYLLDVTKITENSGVFYQRLPAVSITANTGLPYKSFTELPPVNLSMFWNTSYTLQNFVNNSALIAYLSNFTLFSCKNDIVYGGTPTKLSINKVANTAADISVLLNTLRTDYAYYSTVGVTDELWLNTPEIAEGLTTPVTIDVTLKPPIYFNTGIVDTELQQTTVCTYVAVAETSAKDGIELLDVNDNTYLYQTITTNGRGTYTSDIYRLWFNRNLPNSDTTTIFARAVVMDETFCTVAIIIDGYEVSLNNALVQLTNLTADSYKEIKVKYTFNTTSSAYTSVDIQFFSVRGAILNTIKTNTAIFNQTGAIPLTTSCILSSGIVFIEEISLSSLLGSGIGVEDKHI